MHTLSLWMYDIPMHVLKVMALFMQPQAWRNRIKLSGDTSTYVVGVICLPRMKKLTAKTVQDRIHSPYTPHYKLPLVYFLMHFLNVNFSYSNRIFKKSWVCLIFFSCKVSTIYQSDLGTNTYHSICSAWPECTIVGSVVLSDPTAYLFLQYDHTFIANFHTSLDHRLMLNQ